MLKYCLLLIIFKHSQTPHQNSKKFLIVLKACNGSWLMLANGLPSLPEALQEQLILQ